MNQLALFTVNFWIPWQYFLNVWKYLNEERLKYMSTWFYSRCHFFMGKMILPYLENSCRRLHDVAIKETFSTNQCSNFQIHSYNVSNLSGFYWVCFCNKKGYYKSLHISHNIDFLMKFLKNYWKLPREMWIFTKVSDINHYDENYPLFQ